MKTILKSLSFATLILAAVLCIFGSYKPVHAGTIKNWELVYDHDANGNPIKGSLADLVSAIRNGADVQLVAHGPEADVLIKSQHVRIEGGGTLVVANIGDNTWNPSKTDVSLRIMLFRTDGTREIIYQPNSGYSTYTANIPMTWYVNR